MAERCKWCSGIRSEVGEVVFGMSEKERFCYCIEAQKEALESAAKMLEGQERLAKQGLIWGSAVFAVDILGNAAELVRSHRPWEKPKAPRPKLSRKEVEDSLDEAVCCTRKGFVDAIWAVLKRANLTEDE